MKKLFLIIVGLLFFSQMVSAQKFAYVGFGYNLGFGRYDSLNFAIDQYNETRPYLDKQMKNVTTPNGYTFSFGFSRGNATYDFAWVGRHRIVSAEGVDGTGNLVRRDLKFRMNSLNFGMGFTGGEKSLLGFGFSFDLGPVLTFTRVGPADEVDAMEYKKISNNYMLGSTIYIQGILGWGKGPGLIVRPYFQFPYWKISMKGVNYTINPNTAKFKDELNTRFTSCGIQLMFALYRVR